MPPPQAPPPKRGLSKGALVGIVVVVVVIVVVLALLFSGAIPGFKLGGGSSSSGPTLTSFKSALSNANSSATSRGGSWVVIAAVGVDSVVALSLPSGLPGLLGLSCPVANQPSSIPSLPANTGSYSSGDQSGWVFFLFQSSTSTLLLVLVIGSSTTTLGTITGASCFTDYNYFTGATGAIDSPAATSAVASDASAFTSKFSQASSVLFFISGYSISEGGTPVTSGPVWSVSYTNCSLAATTGAGSEFSASVNGTSGAVTNNGGTRSIACSQFSISPPTQQTNPLGSAFAFGAPQEITGTSSTNSMGCATGDYCYVISIAYAGGGLTYSNVGLEVRTAAGATYTGTLQFTFATIVGASAATCSANVCNNGGTTPGWTYGTGYSGASGISSGMTVVADMGTSNPSGLGLQLVALGENGYSGSVPSNLP
jgi:hypothetical protein